MSLPSVATIAYNGITFDSSVDSRISTKFVYDAADRTAKYAVHTITIRGRVLNGGGTDTALLGIRQALSKPGQQLTLQTNGFGGLDINIGAQTDVAWGPKPRMLTWRPIGSNLAALIEWTVEVAIPECTNAAYTGVAGFTYEYEVSIDVDGFSTRTVGMEIEIAMTRVNGGRTLPDCVDLYLEQVNPAIPVGFRRESRTRRVSPDKRTMSVAVVDTQIKAPEGGYPVGIARASGSASIQNEAGNMASFTGGLDVTYTIPPGGSKTAATNAFFALLLSRTKGLAANSTLFPSFRCVEGLHDDNQISFSITWQIITTLQNCLLAGNFWTPVPGTNWQSWSTSVANILAPRSVAGLKLQPSDDAIVDLCIGQNETILKSGGYQPPGQATQSVLKSIATLPQPNQSWVDYKMKLRMRSRPGAARLKLIPSIPPVLTGALGDPTITPIGSSQSTLKNFSSGSTSGTNPVSWAGSTSNRLVTEAVTTPDVIQQRVSGSYRCELVGSALRAGYPVPCPQLTSLAGEEAIPSDHQEFESWSIGNWGGVEIYAAQWTLSYEFASPPDGSISTPSNPFLQFTG